ncbi:MAG: ketose-bisphosphate aldolase [Actinomycetaceae bacterium]|nr:ketose-bisphosphate aldolase [Actinomycetaceae bacterium]
MSLVSLSEVLQQADEGKYAVGAFNVSSLNQVEAIVEAAQNQHSPVILMALAGVSAYDNETQWWKNLRFRLEQDISVPVVLHLDHGSNVDDCYKAVDMGFTSVMIDASRDPVSGKANSYDHNVETTLKVVDYAGQYKVCVEGEIGTIGGGGEGDQVRAVDDITYTSPDEAQEFATTTGVNALAIGVGTSHGSVKYPPGMQPHLRMDLISDIHTRIPDTYLVLHGSSSIDADDVAMINAYHGELPPSCGIDDKEKQEAIAAGIRKINQGTDSHLAFTAAVRKYMAQHREQVDPYTYLKPGIVAMQQLAERRMQLFGSAGKA